MEFLSLINKRVCKITILALFLSMSVSSAFGVEQDTWQHEVTIYGWYTGFDSDAAYPGGPGGGAEIQVDVSDVIDDLEMAFMAGWQSRYNRWSIVFDLIYSDVGDDTDTTVHLGHRRDIPADANVGIDMTSWAVQGGVGYDLLEGEHGVLAAFGGARFLYVDVDIDMNIEGPLGGNYPNNQSQSENVIDGIVGIRGAIELNESWYFPFHVDMGAGDSDFTWQMFGGVGYRFNWGDIKLGYRHLHWDFDDDQILQDLTLSGPVFGISYVF